MTSVAHRFPIYIRQTTRRAALVILLSALPIVLLALSTSLVQAATVYYVEPGGSGSGSSWADATDIYTAVSAVGNGDEIWMKTGVYTTPAPIQFSSIVTVYGGFAGDEVDPGERDTEATPTILSGDILGNDEGEVRPDNPTRSDNSDNVVLVFSGEAVLDGLTISGGNGSAFGAGLQSFAIDLTLRDVIFRQNANGFNGGALRHDGDGISDGEILLEDVVFEDNYASSGGALYGSGDGIQWFLNDVTFSRNVALGGGAIYSPDFAWWHMTGASFEANSAHFDGGAVYLDEGFAIITGTRFIDNDAGQNGGALFCRICTSFSAVDVSLEGNSAGADGGGLHLGNVPATLRQARFVANHSANEGGAIHGSDLTISNGVFLGNEAGTSGGAVYAGIGNLQISQALFGGNRAALYGGAVYNSSSGTSLLLQLTMAYNEATFNGGGIYNLNNFPAIRNSILWGNNHNQIFNVGASTADVAYTLVEGGYSGAGNIDGDPLFADAAGADGVVGTEDDDYRLLASSPAVDAGYDAVIPADTYDEDGDQDSSEPVPTDLNGKPRQVGTVDMGPFERAVRITSPLPQATTILQPYEHAFTVIALPPVTYTLAAGALPPGLALTADGVLSGEATSNGVYSATVRAANASGMDSQSFMIVVSNLRTYLPFAGSVRIDEP